MGRRPPRTDRGGAAGLDQGGTLAVAGIHLSDVPALNYARELFREKQHLARHQAVR
jgi:hypothetical protein